MMIFKILENSRIGKQYKKILDTKFVFSLSMETLYINFNLAMPTLNNTYSLFLQNMHKKL